MQWEEGDERGDVEDRRGVKPAMAAGGGIVGLLIFAVAYFVTGDPRAAKQIADKVGPQVGGGGQTQVKGPPPDPKTKEFAEKILGFTNVVWKEQLPADFNTEYRPPKMVLFSEGVDSGGCGFAPSAVGPFYCPVSKTVFLDPTFFDLLEKKLGGSASDFSKAYVIAHEVGHHVQNLTGYNELLERYRQREGENAGIRLELQADYLAGVCWHHVRRKYPRVIEAGDVDTAITSAKSIGDDKLGGWNANPEKFNHGTSRQRVKYFKDGFQTGDASKRKLDHFFDRNVAPLEL
jgi:predicted metalloprotease